MLIWSPIFFYLFIYMQPEKQQQQPQSQQSIYFLDILKTDF